MRIDSFDVKNTSVARKVKQEVAKFQQKVAKKWSTLKFWLLYWQLLEIGKKGLFSLAFINEKQRDQIWRFVKKSFDVDIF